MLIGLVDKPSISFLFFISLSFNSLKSFLNSKSSTSFCRRKRKSSNMVANDIKISHKMKNKDWLSIGKIILKCIERLILKILVNTQIKMS